MATTHDPRPGYLPGLWPAEDGGPTRRMVPRGPGLGMKPGERLVARTRPAFMCTMVVVGGPGEVWLHGNSGPGEDHVAWVERLDTESLEPTKRVELPAGGMWWPGGMAVAKDGALLVTHGRFCHRLDPDLNVQAARELPRPTPYNSLLILPDGTLVMKNLTSDAGVGSAFMCLDPVTLAPRGPEVPIPEPSVARISADGDVVYALGDRHVYRWRWNGETLVRDAAWEPCYRTAPDDEQTFGWDAVLVDGAAWFLDNGANVFGMSFRGGGTARGPLHLVRASLTDPADVRLFAPFGDPHGTVANPPLVDPSRKIVVCFDSGNARIGGFRYADAGDPTSLWRHDFGAGNHFLLFPDTGEIVVNDHQDDTGDHCVVLDIETGAEKGRVAVDSPVQSVVFPAPGFARDVYWCSFSTVARVSVA